MNALAEQLTEAFTLHSSRLALQIADDKFNYSDLFAVAKSCASQLDAMIPAGARVGLLANRTLGAYAGVLAAILTGRPYVPIFPKAPPERQRAIASVARCAAYVCDQKSVGMGASLSTEFGGGLLCVEPIKSDVYASGSIHSSHAYVMFTSGTTGTPKGVSVRYDNVAAYLKAFREIALIQPDDRCTQLFDLSFDLSVHDMLVTWTSGACLCVPTEEELIDPVGFASRTDVSCWFSVPSMVTMARRMRRLQSGVLPKLRLSLFCGEPLPTSIATAWSSAAPNSEIWNLYGPTEATIAITAYHFDPSQVTAAMPATVPLGDAYGGCAVVVVGADRTPVAMNEVGELWLAGEQLTDGYINNPEEQAAKFVSAMQPGHPYDIWYRSGDLVRRDSTWGLIYTGRLDDQVKISGYRVELLEIEEALRWATDSPEVAVVPWPLTEGGSAEGLVGFVCESKFSERNVIMRCRTRLPPYMVPKRIITLDALPLNANGKVDRKALRKNHLE